MESYQSSDIASQEQGRLPFKIAKEAPYIAGALIGGTSLLARAVPFLSRYIAAPTAIKGLTKLDPRLGKFIKTSMAAGYTFEEIKRLIGEKFEEEQQQEERKKQPANVQEAMKMNIAKAAKRQPSDFSRESLQQQFQQGYGSQGEQPGKVALLNTMQEITNILRSLRGQGG